MSNQLRLAAILVATIPTTLHAQQIIHVPPTAVRTWQDMVEFDRAEAGNDQRQQTGVPSWIGEDHPVRYWASMTPLLNGRSLDRGSQFDASLRLPCAACPGETALAYGFQALLGSIPVAPQTMGAVGPNHVMTMLGSQVRIHLKSGAILSTVSMATFWMPVVPWAPGMTRLVFDALSGRWIAVGGFPLLAISSSDDPSGVWTYYQLPRDQYTFFITLGLNSNWIVIAENAYDSNLNFQGTKMWVIDKQSALSGGPLTMTIFPPGFDGPPTSDLATLSPCVTLDPGEPALYIVNNAGLDPSDNTNMIRLSQITGTGSAPIWSVVLGSIYPDTGLFRVANVYNLDAILGANCGGGGLWTLNARFRSHTILRNGRIWAANHGTLPAGGTPDRTVALWYEIDPTAMPNPIVQSGVIDGGPGSSHMFPSIAANCAGDACIGFTRSDAVRCPEAAFTTRLAADPPGTTRPVQTLRHGEGPFSYNNAVLGSPYYWGYYSATMVDPVDDRTFWTIQEYVGPTYMVFIPSPATHRMWGTWWGRITQDCNLNGTADLCEAVVHDCNENGISDACECCHGDVNGDGLLNGADVSAFATALTNQPSCAGPEFLTFCRADADRDGALTTGDIAAFVQLLLAGPGCP